MVDFLEVTLSFVLGLFSGGIIQALRLRDSLKVEKVKRLTPLLEAAFPIIENLAGDSQYAKSLQIRGDDGEFQRVLERVSDSLEEYDKWYTRFQVAGLSPALESIDPDLLARFNGILMNTRLLKLHGITYLSQNMQEFAQYCQKCKSALKNRLSK